MFQSAGLFKDVSCPYYLYGLCERPYCHFKHSKQEEAKARKDAEAVIEKKESDEPYVLPTSSLQKTLQAIEKNIKTEKKKLKDEENSHGKKQGKKSLKNKPTGTPEYNPTPIPELKQKQTPELNGRSKYDLALLQKPNNDTEYDPECNYSGIFQSGSKENDTLPDYAKPLHGSVGVKRPASDAEDEEESLAKIPKFVSVDYTPAVPDELESEEDPLADHGDSWFENSENESEKSSDSSNILISDNAPEAISKESKPKDPPKEDKSLPIEFTADGFVKFTPKSSEPVKIKSEKSKNLEKSSKENKVKDVIEKNVKETDSSDVKGNSVSQKSDRDDVPKKPEREGNIFSLFKEEFDKVLDSCDKKETTLNNIDKVKDRRKSSDSDVSDKTRRKSSDTESKGADRKTKEIRLDKHSHEKEKSHSHENNKLNPHEKHKSHSHENHKSGSHEKLKSHESHRSYGLEKHRSHSHEDHKSYCHENHKSHSHESHKSHLHEIHKSHSHENHKSHSQEKHRSHSHETHKSHSHESHRSHSHENHKSRSVEHHKHDSKDDRSAHVSTSKHTSDHRSRSTEKSSLKHGYSSNHLSLSREHLNTPSKHSSSRSKHSSSSSKEHKHHSSSKNDKHGSSKHNDSEKHRESQRKSSKHEHESPRHKKKKKTIVNLDVDLFGEDVLNLSNSRQDNDDDDDLADLAKYFEDEDPFEECLRIFNEDQGKTDSFKAPEKKKLKVSSTNDSVPPATVGKKRIGLKENDESVKRQKVEDKPKPKPSPAQVMMNRYKMMQERALQEEQERKDKIKAKVKEMQAEKKANPVPQVSGPSLSGSMTTFTTYMKDKNKKTTAITVAKGAKRKAHTPTVAVEKLKRPVVEVTSSSKVPANVRQRYLNMFIDECLKLCSSEQEAYDKGKEEEEAVFSRCSNKKIYLNIAVNTIKRLRREIDDKKTNGKSTKKSMKLSHASVLDGAHAAKSSYTVNRSGGAVKLREEDFSGADLYKRLKAYVLTEEQLNVNNFPRPDPNKGGCAVFLGEQDKSQKGSVKGYEKICIRCGRRFEVYPNGKYPKKEECIYHWGKAWKKRVAGTVDTRYTCCSGDLSAEGCQVAKAHVHETNKKENFSGYMKTIPCSPPIDGDYGVYAMDCEMVYTTMGMELARVTVVGGDCEIAYESLVQPDNKVVDCNTRFSGITDEDLEDVHTSLRDVQAVLLSLFTDKTILIGHSLESDLTALKLIHNTVVDTSIVFPHRMGLPYKRALKNLMAEYLKKIIQDDVAGHDSHEDALACIQLMQFKLKEDARKEARRLSS